MGRFELSMIAKKTLSELKDRKYWGGTKEVEIVEPRSISGRDHMIDRKLNGNWFDYTPDVLRSNTVVEQIIQSADSTKNVCALNFASWKTPGGRWLEGESTQEESLARCTSLMLAIGGYKNTLYKNNIDTDKSGIGSNSFIYSKNLQVLKYDDGTVLEEPVYFSCITLPAPNCSVAWRKHSTDKLRDVMRHRIYEVISIAVTGKVDTLILGAYGCGAYGNPKGFVADTFREAINDLVEPNSMEIIFTFPGSKPKAFSKR